MINIKHQIFISSTYADLIKERQRLFRATYRLNHIPIGMEGFVASNKAQWEYIERRVRESDYFVLVLAHRYGSRIPDASGRSFTEAEYDLAVALGKPILRFIINNAAHWPGDQNHRDSDQDAQDRLRAFKDRISAANLCDFWSDEFSLEGAYSQALAELIKEDPRGGLCPVGTHPSLDKIGIIALDEVSNSADHKSILASAGPVTIVLNDGYHFIQKYRNEIAERANSSRLTRTLLVHPDSKNIELVTRKSNKSLDQQINDIRKTVEILRDISAKTASGKLIEVRGHHYLNNYSATLSNEEAIVSLYFTRIRSNELTTMRLKAGTGSLHHRYSEDIDQLWREVESESASDLLA
ncbi:DUF4062 domain-containing protein [Paraburkholderia sp. J94]|uniref:DUF4062 domain-containing protein n=1 Tax=Paraburkholderia sp. J94 TaxID=2805441 RepID=UPI002AB11C3D|nr:DUF4062 domain-containing protein [Paraburkholderia sp. J94]